MSGGTSVLIIMTVCTSSYLSQLHGSAVAARLKDRLSAQLLRLYTNQSIVVQSRLSDQLSIRLRLSNFGFEPRDLGREVAR